MKTDTKNKPETKPATIDQTALIAAIEKMFKEDAWEIPDECIVGPFKKRIDQLEARVNHLTDALLALTEKLNGKPAAPAGRVDALEATTKAKGK